MSTLTFTRAIIFSSLSTVAITLLCWPALAGWKFKFDREATDMRGNKSRPFVLELDSSMKGAPSPGRLGHGSVTGEMELGGEERRAPSPVLRGALPELMPVQEISLILTDEGFAPAKLHVKRGEAYQVTVVNVSGAHRNSSLVIPSLSIYEGIFFATPSTFQIQADHEGLFHFLSPESGTRGELVVYEVPAQGAPSPVGPVEQMHGVEVEAPSPPGLVPLRVPTSAGRK